MSRTILRYAEIFDVNFGGIKKPSTSARLKNICYFCFHRYLRIYSLCAVLTCGKAYQLIVFILGKSAWFLRSLGTASTCRVADEQRLWIS